MAKSKNENLSKAKNNKKDEFYTQLSDIENELKHYKEHFKGKTVLCNCDDPYESNFVKFFALNFNVLGLKKLIATSYATSPIVYTQLSFLGEEEEITVSERKPYFIEVTEVTDLNGDGAIDLKDFELLLKKNKPKKLKGDGDFRSPECIEFLKQADIVVTNPPFSLFREYMAVLMQYNKQFLIIGNVNAITYKDVFPLIKDNKLWLGVSMHSGNSEFIVPDSYSLQASGFRIDEKGRKYIRVNARWFTNLEYSKRYEDLILYKKYNAEEYPKYDNYDAIEVSKTAEIPCDYDGIMGVPITFLDKYNPKQFEILGITDSQNTSNLRTKKYTIEDAPNYNGLNAGSVLKMGNVYKQVYARILIKKRGNINAN